MRRDQAGNSRLLVCLLLALSACAFSCGRETAIPTRIAGTEGIIAGEGAWFSLSPDDKWLIYLELDTLGPGAAITPEHYQLASINLQTDKKTRHIPTDDALRVLGTEETEPWGTLPIYLKEAGWQNDRFYLRISRNHDWIAVSPSTVDVVRESPSGELSCSDCGPAPVERPPMDARDINELNLKAPSGPPSYETTRQRDGKTVRCLRKDHGTTSVVECIRDGERAAAVFKESRVFSEVTTRGVVLSPDARLLAVTVGVRLRSLIPSPFVHDELWIVDLEEGHRYRVPFRTRIIGSAMWSSDSTLLYFAASEGDGSDRPKHGVYRVSFH